MRQICGSRNIHNNNDEQTHAFDIDDVDPKLNILHELPNYIQIIFRPSYIFSGEMRLWAPRQVIFAMISLINLQGWAAVAVHSDVLHIIKGVLCVCVYMYI